MVGQVAHDPLLDPFGGRADGAGCVEQRPQTLGLVTLLGGQRVVGQLAVQPAVQVFSHATSPSSSSTRRSRARCTRILSAPVET
ncbi:MAG: hypothetical protein P8177_03535, partial [Gemmatimonadota bacterium]